MAESLKEVIARIKQQNSQKSKEKIEPVRQEIEEQEEQEIEMPELEPAKPIPKPMPVQAPIQRQEVPVVKQEEKIEPQQAIAQEVNILFNEGIFRRELLVQLNEINKSLESIGLLIAKISGENIQ